MLSLVMPGDMNRSEQENLYRTSRKLSLVPIAGNHSHGNFESDRQRRSSCAKAYEDHPSPKCHDHYAEDHLVLSVLKSPLNHVGADQREVSYGTSVETSDLVRCTGKTTEDYGRDS